MGLRLTKSFKILNNYVQKSTLPNLNYYVKKDRLNDYIKENELLFLIIQKLSKKSEQTSLKTYAGKVDLVINQKSELLSVQKKQKVLNLSKI